MRPFKYPLPAELQLYRSLFSKCGVQEKFSVTVLIDVLHDINAKHRAAGVSEEASEEAISRDLQLAVDILNQLKLAAQNLGMYFVGELCEMPTF